MQHPYPTQYTYLDDPPDTFQGHDEEDNTHPDAPNARVVEHIASQHRADLLDLRLHEADDVKGHSDGTANLKSRQGTEISKLPG